MIGNIYISGQIGTFDGVTGVTLVDVIGQVKSQPQATAFNVYIDSEGGIFDVGFDIYNYLRRLGKPITTIGRGMVASIATVIFMAGNRRQLAEGAKFMIHAPWVSVEGNAATLAEYAVEIGKYEKQLLNFYKSQLSLPSEAIAPLMRDETWLSPTQLKTLGFITSQPRPIVAKAVINTKNENKMSETLTERDRTWMEGLFERVLGRFRSGAVMNKLVQDANGTEIDFPDLEDADTVEVGAQATVDGLPADGEYTMPTGEVYVFKAGELTEIKPADGGGDSGALTEENKQLKQELNKARAKAATAQARLKDLQREVTLLKAQVKSKFRIEPVKNPAKNRGNHDSADRAAGIREYLKTKKR